MMFVTPEQHRETFLGTRGRKGVKYRLVCNDGWETNAMYFDGMWEPAPPVKGRVTLIGGSRGDSATKVSAKVKCERVPGTNEYRVWGRSNFHAIVFNWRAYRVGIRGPRLSGVDFDELVRIASSMTVRA